MRNARRHPLLGVLNVLSVALGIAVFLAIQIANHSANRSFAAGVDLVAGKAHLEVRGEIDEALWPRIAAQPGVIGATAVIEGVLTLSDFPGEYLKVLGVDLFTSEPFRTFEIASFTPGKPQFSFEAWLSTANGLAVTEEFARKHRLQVGSTLRVVAHARESQATILSIIPAANSPSAAQQRFAAMDLGWAQELFGRQGTLSSIQLRLEEPLEAPAFAERLRALVPPDLQVAAPRQRSYQMQSMLSAFQLNLSALSMVSLLVGTFLIYNTISASVARRRVEIGILRALGATRWEVRGLFLGEACLFGVIGIALGSICGVALGHSLLGAVAKTISSLYLLVSVERAFLHPWQFVVAGVFGLGAVLIGAWKPADDAARIPPVAALSMGAPMEQSIARRRGIPWIGLLSLVLGSACSALALSTGPAALAFGGAFFVLVGCACFAPAATVFTGWLAVKWASAPVAWRLGADNLGRTVHRNAITVAALSSAIAMAIGLLIMIHSFRQTVGAWIEQGIVADLFIAPASNETVGLGAAVPVEVISWLEARPEIASVDGYREETVQVETSEGAEPALMAVIKGAPRDNVQFLGGDSASKLHEVFFGGAVAVTESFARRFRLLAGDQLRVRTPGGVAAFRIVGVYTDYSRDQGVILIAATNFIRHFGEAPAQSMAVYLKPGSDLAGLVADFEKGFSAQGQFVVYSNRSLRERIFAIFDQTFAVTYVLRTVAIIVAITGIFLSVTTLVAERERESGVLRAIGAARGQIQQLFMTEAALIGCAASGLGMIAGVLLAVVLTWIVNPAFFGWTIALQIPWTAVLVTPLWIVPFAVGASWGPAWRGSRKAISAAIREE